MIEVLESQRQALLVLRSKIVQVGLLPLATWHIHIDRCRIATRCLWHVGCSSHQCGDPPRLKHRSTVSISAPRDSMLFGSGEMALITSGCTNIDYPPARWP